MLELIPLLLATPIAQIILNKLYEGAGSKLGEKAISAATVPIQKLGQVVWDRCFKGKPGADKLLEQAAAGSQPEMEKLKAYLLKALEDQQLAQEVEPIAQEIHQVLVQFDDINARNVQPIYGGQGLQVNDPKSQVIQTGDHAKFYFGDDAKD